MMMKAKTIIESLRAIISRAEDDNNAEADYMNCRILDDIETLIERIEKHEGDNF